MSIRRKLHENQGLGIAVSLLAILIMVFMIYRQAQPLPEQGRPGAYFTIDEGKTLFLEDSTKIVPFEKDGKEAVRAYVFTCDGGKTQFIGYLGKMTNAARDRLLAAEAAEHAAANPAPGATAPPTGNTASRQNVEAALPDSAYLFKRPGEGQWLPMDQAEQIRAIRCPNGASFTAVLPTELFVPAK